MTQSPNVVNDITGLNPVPVWAIVTRLRAGTPCFAGTPYRRSFRRVKSASQLHFLWTLPNSPVYLGLR